MQQSVTYYYDQREWADVAKVRGHVLVPCSNGIVAQTALNGAARGFWSHTKNRGSYDDE